VRANDLPSTVALRPIGTALPLGFVALTVATSSFSAVQLGWIGPLQNSVVAVGVIVFAVPLQLLASVMGFLGRDSVVGTANGVLAGTWAALSLNTVLHPLPTNHPGVGVLLVAAGAVLAISGAGAGAKPVAGLVLLTAATRFVVTGVYELSGIPGWKTTAGWVGIALAVVAFYGALAFELEGAYGRTILPTGRRQSVSELGPPGVRSQL
jgi:succinate-acetate transporter protein